jgi:hypothetical protein
LPILVRSRRQFGQFGVQNILNKSTREISESKGRGTYQCIVKVEQSGLKLGGGLISKGEAEVFFGVVSNGEGPLKLGLRSIELS